MRETAKRSETSNLEATGSTPVGRAKNTAEMRHSEALQTNALQTPLGTLQKQMAQSGTKLAQNRAQSVPEVFPTTIIAELTRARCVFQARAIEAILKGESK